MYNPELANFLDWTAVCGFIGLTAFVTWQVMTRSNPKE